MTILTRVKFCDRSILLSVKMKRKVNGKRNERPIFLVSRINLGSRVVSVLDSGAVGLGSNSSRDAVG